MTVEPCEDGRSKADFDACSGKGAAEACVLSDGSRGACVRLVCADEPTGERVVCVAVAKMNDASLPSSEPVVTGGELAGGSCSLGIAPAQGFPSAAITLALLVSFALLGITRRRRAPVKRR